MIRNAKWIAFILAGILTVCLILPGCTGPSGKSQADSRPRDELIISVGKGAASGGYDPCTGYGIYGYGLFFSSLLRFNADIEVHPDLATGYTVSKDGLTYTYHLREDVKFSDGTPLTAKDVVFTYLTAKSSGSSVDLTVLASAQAVDNKTVVFILHKPWSPFASTTALLGIVPEHAYGREFGDKPVGSGPWKLAQLDKEQQLIVVPNEYYYGTKPSFKKVTILNLEEEAALASAKSGRLDVVMVNPEYSKETVEGMHLVALPTVDNRGFNLPVTPESSRADGKVAGNNVTSDFAIRKALNIGIDRKKIIQNALSGVGTPAYGRVDALPWFNPSTPFKDNQVEEARQILEAAGWKDTDGDSIREKNGLKAEFTITGRTDDLQRYNLAVALSEDAKKLGIHLKAQAAPWTDCKSQALHTPTCWGSGDYNPLDLYNGYYSQMAGVGSNNPSSYSNPQVDAYIDQALAATSMEEAIRYWQLAQWDGKTGINADYPFLWIVNIDHTYFVRDGLDLGKQLLHPHGHGQPVIANMNEWQMQQ
ncbi:ABC transporter substrate-binding protein [Acetonema longum]|uniref:Solute-binding protein family 5 domain-containing protein n=1 Tax=Acetonema longum DSM 6540 TaxID=1009370 RepID=F7NEQ7_9FIRM|nr:ABC transporter substrate-binding protein [Acetonema longum]EGO65468.1 hypothetical protein ALO_02611 [Acetonema longum DSM 6540]